MKVICQLTHLHFGHLAGFDLQVFQVAPSVYMVELRKATGDTLEYHKVTQTAVLILLLASWLQSSCYSRSACMVNEVTRCKVLVLFFLMCSFIRICRTD